MKIDPRFIDVDFPSQPQYRFGCAGERTLDQDGPQLCYEDAVEILSESRVREIIEAIEREGSGIENLVTRIYNQLNEGSCVANACGQAHEVIQARQFGRDRVTPLSAMSLYQFIGSSPNSGAMTSDGLEVGSTKGFVPLDTPENRQRFGEVVMPNTGWRTRRPDGWEPIAKQFAFHERFIIRSRAELLTAGANGDPVVVGRAGHSICYLRPTWRDGWLYGYANSWGRWGSAWGTLPSGFGFDSMRLIQSSASWCFAIRSVKVPAHLSLAA